MIVSTSLIISLVEITSSACHVRTDNRLTLLKTTRYSVVTYVRHSMFFFFVFVRLLNTRCGTIQSEEIGDQSVEQERLLLNIPLAMNDRLIDLERKMQAMNGEISSLKSENSLLKSTMAANTNSANSKISSLESDNNLLKSTMAADADCKLHD